MGFFGSNKNNIRYGALLDIGSGSVLASIVRSDEKMSNPEIIWSKREYSPLKKSELLVGNSKSILTSLMNVMMLLDSQGRQKLYETSKTNNIDFLQVSISAPWSHTTTKTISYSNEEEFEVTTDLVSELIRTAEKKSAEELETREKINDFGFSIINRRTLQIFANEYPINVTGKQKAKSLKIVEATVVAQKNILSAIEDIKDKILPKAELSLYSFMLPYYFVTNSIGNNSEYCLVDITYEATEIGIVRNGFLNYSTHCTYGAYSLARDISEILKISPDEAYGYLTQEDIFTFMNSATEEQKTAVSTIIDVYVNKLADLFKETGDSLAIPRKVYIHGNLKNEVFFDKQIKLATKVATRLDHATYKVTEQILNKYYKESSIVEKQDTALLITAQFFHTVDQYERFDQL